MRSVTIIGLAIGMMVSIAMVACSPMDPPDNLPPEVREAVAVEPKSEQEAFLARPADQQKLMVVEFQRRQRMLNTFTPVEKTIISSMSQADEDDFFKIPPDRKSEQEAFLTQAVSTYLNSLEQCQINTHRRFAADAPVKLSSQSLIGFTPSEQALIRHLTPAECKHLFAESKPQQETYLSDTLNRKVADLLSCATRSNRRLRDFSG